MKRRVREVIVVEGRYDKNALAQVVEATILETRGFGIFRDREMAAFLRRLARERGLILLTDSDGAGFVIRNHLRGILPPNTPVKQGMKAGDVDPRGNLSHCYTVSDKALAIGGGVLEAILQKTGLLGARG